ncbi:flagellar basal body L-ring protein FlgH [Siculibacillus lacustris]|uniref:Flagellar L-ring protein n=1 Tax=Siculibacillus lacustris TaxID=1549641 RepID=A0A4Q9VF61_9HYPH|nr:flagellar basal body L-ring protein FlgH [Siculibacillus lacustris]TBW33494.1 flagellar basal body L-ring protein FlgH [Siculibacillus lacustris]
MSRRSSAVLRSGLLLVLALPLAACGNSLDRLSEIGKAPKLASIDDPTTNPGYKPVSMPMPAPEPPAYAPNSLWSRGSRAFFKDQRAHRIGDILTVQVVITDKAQIANDTKRTRAETDATGIGGLPGAAVNKLIQHTGATASNLVNNTTNTSAEGIGTVNRSETLQTNVAALVTQILPNGNMVIEGRQEIRVNFEIREMIVAGVVRPEDIGSDNTIDSAKIAEARISYGGRGQLTDVQQARYGTQFLDVIMPF